MARKKVAAELEFPEQSKEEFDLEEFVSEIGPGTAFIDVFRIKTDGSSPRVGRVTLDVLREDVYGYLAETFGTGKYDLQFKGADRRIQAQKRLAVEAPAGVGPQFHSAYGNGNGNGNGQKDNFERELLLAMIAAQKPLDVGSLMAGMAAMQPKFDVAGMLSSMVAVFVALKPAETAKEDWLEKLPKLLSITKDLMPASHEENLYTVAKDVGTKLIDSFKPRPSGVVEAPAQDAPQQLPAQTPLALSEENLQKWIAAQLVFLKDKAKKDKDPGAWVDYIFDNDDEPGCNAILIALDRGVTFEMLCSFDTEIASNPQLNAWFRRLYDGLHSELNPVVDTAGAAGDVGNSEAYADPGAPNLTSDSTQGVAARKSRKRQ